MTKKFDSIIDELKYYLTLQLEAYLDNDKDSHDLLEGKISELEKKL